MSSNDKSNFVTRECELKVVLTYQPIMDLHTCRLLSEVPPNIVVFPRGAIFWAIWGGAFGGGRLFYTLDYAIIMYELWQEILNQVPSVSNFCAFNYERLKKSFSKTYSMPILRKC